jgi:hypothetical protein
MGTCIVRSDGSGDGQKTQPGRGLRGSAQLLASLDNLKEFRDDSDRAGE